MPNPIVEQIALELESRLQNVTEANGFNQDLDVKRPARWGAEKADDGLAIIIQDDPTTDTPDARHPLSVAGNPYAQAYTQPFRVLLFSRQSEKDDTAAETYVNRMWADAVKAITRSGETDEADWQTFGDLAITSNIGPPSLDLWKDGISAVIEFAVEVQYRTEENDPYTGR